MTFVADGVEVYTLSTLHEGTDIAVAGTRRRLPRERLPWVPFRLLEVFVQCTGRFRLYPGTVLHWKALGGLGGLQTFPLGQETG